LKLNQEKCGFGVQRGKVLGCLVSIKGIKANPNKINAIVHMKSPQSKKEVQRLTSKITALNRFMSKLAERSWPFFTILRGSDHFQWGQEQPAAFDELKDHIQKLSMLSSPQPDQSLILYVSS
jgi:phenylalanine-4-hydroxylase